MLDVRDCILHSTSGRFAMCNPYLSDAIAVCHNNSFLFMWFTRYHSIHLMLRMWKFPGDTFSSTVEGNSGKTWTKKFISTGNRTLARCVRNNDFILGDKPWLNVLFPGKRHATCPIPNHKYNIQGDSWRMSFLQGIDLSCHADEKSSYEQGFDFSYAGDMRSTIFEIELW